MRVFVAALAAFIVLTAAVYASCGGLPPQPPAPTPVPPTAAAATDCAANPPTTTAGANQMAILAPCSPNVVGPQPALFGVWLTDERATLPAGCIPVQVQASGMKNVEVWVHGKRAATLAASGNGEFIGVLDLSAEQAGPLHVLFEAWDVAAGQPATVTLTAGMTLLVAGTRAVMAPPPPAAGMTLAFSDHFDKLSATACKPGTGTWPTCTAPTAADGFTWYENLWNGQDYGDCANEHTDGKYNPFTILPSGGLRIRDQYDANYVDPYGYKRTHYCGVLSSGFKDGTTSITGSDGYYDARVLVPNSACGAAGNNTCSGGTWPAFWMLSLNGGGIGTFELDMMEMYGNNPAYFQGYTHAYAPAVFPPGAGKPYAGQPGGDLTLDWHTVGMKVAGSGTAAGTICNYFDEVQLSCSPMPQFAAPGSAAVPAWSVMLELASGGGWRTHAPPGGYYDMFIDWVAVWH